MTNHKSKFTSTNQNHTANFSQKIFQSLITIIFLFPIMAYSQEYKPYTMFEHFEIVAPSTPKQMIKNTMYGSKEVGKDTGIIVTKLDTGLESDVGEYNEIIKQHLDTSISQGEDVAGNKVTRLTSTLDRKKNTYIATYFVSPKKAGDGPYMAKKSIVKGKTDYTWYVTSYDKNDVERIFNKYKNRINFVYGNSQINEEKIKSLQQHKNACDLNKSTGCIKLALAYRKGKDLKKDNFKAAQLYKKACDLKNGRGCALLGVEYEKGDSLNRDAFKAIELFKKACNLENGTGCLLLGVAYYKGEGVRKNYKKAKEFFGKACDLKVKGGCTSYAEF